MTLRAAAILALGTAPLSYTIQRAEAGKVIYHGAHLADGPTGAPHRLARAASTLAATPWVFALP